VFGSGHRLINWHIHMHTTMALYKFTYLLTFVRTTATATIITSMTTDQNLSLSVLTAIFQVNLAGLAGVY